MLVIGSFFLGVGVTKILLLLEVLSGSRVYSGRLDHKFSIFSYPYSVKPKNQCLQGPQTCPGLEF